jgi:hypothetical protein
MSATFPSRIGEGLYVIRRELMPSGDHFLPQDFWPEVTSGSGRSNRDHYNWNHSL